MRRKEKQKVLEGQEPVMSAGEQVVKKKKKKRWPIVLAAVIAISGIGVIASCGSDDSSSESEKTTETSPAKKGDEKKKEKTVFGLGEAAGINGVDVKIIKAVISEGDGFMEPDKGNVFLGLVFEVVNNSNDKVYPSTMDMEAYADDASVNETLDTIDEFEGYKMLGNEVGAGKKAVGYIVYEVPAEFEKFEIAYSPSFWSSKNVKFEFTQKEVAAFKGVEETQVAPKKDDKKEPTYKVGDTAKVKDIDIKLDSVFLSKGSEYDHPDKGNAYLGVVFNAQNNGTDSLSLSEYDFEAYADNSAVDTVLAYDVPETEGMKGFSGDVAKGKKLNGYLVYEVPEDFKEFEITFKPSLWSNKSVTFTVTPANIDE